MRSNNEEISMNNEFNIIELLMIDHRSLKECIAVIIDDKTDKYTKLKYSKKFLEVLKKYSEAEGKTVYDSLSGLDSLGPYLREQEVEYEIINKIVTTLLPKIAKLKILDVHLEVEVKALARFVGYRLKKEEFEVFPKILKHLDKSILNEIGFQFMIMRKFSASELKSTPLLQKEIYQIQSSNEYNVYSVSTEFIKKVNRYINSLVSDSQFI